MGENCCLSCSSATSPPTEAVTEVNLQKQLYRRSEATSSNLSWTSLASTSWRGPGRRQDGRTWCKLKISSVLGTHYQLTTQKSNTSISIDIFNFYWVLQQRSIPFEFHQGRPSQLEKLSRSEIDSECFFHSAFVMFLWHLWQKCSIYHFATK